MASETRKYESLYGGKRKLTASEYLAQILVARKIEADGNKVINNFWNNTILLKQVKLNEVFLRKLISVYGEMPVVRTFTRPDMQHVWSSNYPGLEKYIEEERRKIDEADKIKPPEISENREHKREEYGNKTLIGKLRDLE